jgi:hypothetical protein
MDSDISCPCCPYFIVELREMSGISRSLIKLLTFQSYGEVHDSSGIFSSTKSVQLIILLLDVIFIQMIASNYPGVGSFILETN